MGIHKNARLTFIRREQLIRQVILERRTLNSAAAEFKVCARTAAKWVRRYRQEGLAGLCDRSSRPHGSPRRTADAVVQQVEQLRRQRLTGMHIAQTTGCSRATVSRILRRLGLNRWRDLEPMPPIVRYEHQVPGDLLHLALSNWDVSLTSRSVLTGTDVAHITPAGSIFTSLSTIIPALLSHKSCPTSLPLRLSLSSALLSLSMPRLGIRIRAILTDNGHCYRSHAFHQACIQLGLRHRFTRPYTPRTNGKAERFIQTALREWVYARAYQNSSLRNDQMQPWLHHYNWHRPHGSLNHVPPIRRSGLDPDNLLKLHNYTFLVNSILIKAMLL